MSQFHENLQTDERRDRRTDGQTLFYRTLPVEAESPIRKIMALPQNRKFETRNRKLVVGSTRASLKHQLEKKNFSFGCLKQMQIMWNTCGECSTHSEWLQYVSTERLQEKTR